MYMLAFQIVVLLVLVALSTVMVMKMPSQSKRKPHKCLEADYSSIIPFNIVPEDGMTTLSVYQQGQVFHSNAIGKGFWSEDKDPRLGDPVYKITLMISELIETFEDIRSGMDPAHVWIAEDGKPEGPAIEIADLYVRLLDYCAHWDIPLVKLAEMKHNYNTGRPVMHGKNF